MSDIWCWVCWRAGPTEGLLGLGWTGGAGRPGGRIGHEFCAFSAWGFASPTKKRRALPREKLDQLFCTDGGLFLEIALKERMLLEYGRCELCMSLGLSLVVNGPAPIDLQRKPRNNNKAEVPGGWAAAPRSHGGAAAETSKRKLLEALGAHAPCGHRCALHPHSLARMWWPCPPPCLGPLVAPNCLCESCLTFWLGGRRGGDPSKGNAQKIDRHCYWWRNHREAPGRLSEVHNDNGNL